MKAESQEGRNSRREGGQGGRTKAEGWKDVGRRLESRLPFNLCLSTIFPSAFAVPSFPPSAREFLPSCVSAFLPFSDASLFPSDIPRRLVVAQPDERCVAQAAVARPFGERHFGHQRRLHPSQRAHLLGRDALAPVAAAAGRQIGERASRRLAVVPRDEYLRP